MLTDLYGLLATAMAVTASGITLSTDYVDTQAAQLRDVGAGEPLVLNTSVVTAPSAAGAAGTTMAFALIGLHDTQLTRTLVPGAIATDLFTLANHGFPTGAPIFVTTISAANGLTANQIYFVIRVSADTFKVATTLANAKAGTAVDLTTNDGATVTINHVPTYYAHTGPIVRELLLAGRRFVALSQAQIDPKEGLPLPRYVFGAAITTNTFTGGTYTMTLVESTSDQMRFYPGGFTLA